MYFYNIYKLYLFIFIMVINNIIRELDNDLKNQEKEIKKELSLINKNKLNAVVFYNKYGEPVVSIPYFLKEYNMYSYIKKYNIISKDDYLKIKSYDKKINKLINDKREFIKCLIK